jgi:hypothetical protein
MAVQPQTAKTKMQAPPPKQAQDNGSAKPEANVGSDIVKVNPKAMQVVPRLSGCLIVR